MFWTIQVQLWFLHMDPVASVAYKLGFNTQTQSFAAVCRRCSDSLNNGMKCRLTLAFSVGSMTMPLVELLSSRETTHRNSAWSSLP